MFASNLKYWKTKTAVGTHFTYFQFQIFVKSSKQMEKSKTVLFFLHSYCIWIFCGRDVLFFCKSGEPRRTHSASGRRRFAHLFLHWPSFGFAAEQIHGPQADPPTTSISSNAISKMCHHTESNLSENNPFVLQHPQILTLCKIYVFFALSMVESTQNIGPMFGQFQWGPGPNWPILYWHLIGVYLLPRLDHLIWSLDYWVYRKI